MYELFFYVVVHLNHSEQGPSSEKFSVPAPKNFFGKINFLAKLQTRYRDNVLSTGHTVPWTTKTSSFSSP